MNLNKLKDKIYKNAIAHGWHDEEYSDSHWLCLVIAELMEAIEADRNYKYAYRKDFEESLIKLGARAGIRKWREAFEICIKDRLEDELADACIRILDLAGLRNIDMGSVDIKELKSSEGFFNWTFTESMFYIISQIMDICHDSEMDDRFLRSVICEIFRYCIQKNIDIEWYISQKMKYNKFRPFKHGNKKY